MQVALDVAKSGGAAYSDVRVAARRQQSVNTRDKIVQGVSDNDTFGLGVRTLVDGAWGFAATSNLTRDNIAATTRLALEQAKANRASSIGVNQTARAAISFTSPPPRIFFWCNPIPTRTTRTLPTTE